MKGCFPKPHLVLGLWHVPPHWWSRPHCVLKSSGFVIRSVLIRIQMLLPSSPEVWASYSTSLDSLFLICRKGRSLPPKSVWDQWEHLCPLQGSTCSKSLIRTMPLLPLVTACSGYCVLAIESLAVCRPPAWNKKKERKKGLPVLAWHCEGRSVCFGSRILGSSWWKIPQARQTLSCYPGLVEIALWRIPNF